jgi:hypothetical protein
MKNLFALFLLGAALSPAAVLIQLDPPSGGLTANPGQTVGWGFTIESLDYYFVPSAVNFVPASGDGIFTDLLAPRLTTFVAGPAPGASPSVTEAFSLINGTGLASFTVNNSVPSGTLINGTILVDYDLFTVSPNDPSFDPGTHYYQSGSTISLDASVLVSSTPTGDVPEPSAAILVLGGASWLILRRRFSRS